MSPNATGQRLRGHLPLWNPKRCYNTMNEQRLLNIKEAARFLGIPESRIKDLVKTGKLDAYQIGGMYLRFKQRHLQEFKNRQDRFLPTRSHQTKQSRLSYKQSFLFDNIKDFIYFNDFYILAALIIIALLFIILRNIG